MKTRKLPTKQGWMLIASVAMLNAHTALASDTIQVNREAEYAAQSVGNDALRNECRWNALLMDTLVRYGHGRIEMTDRDLRGASGKTLTVLVTNVHSAGGGGFSGPKWANIRGIVRDGSVVVDEFEIASHTNGGGHGACGALDKMAAVLGKKAAQRVLHETKSRRNRHPDPEVESSR
jgi:hypothetical protein